MHSNRLLLSTRHRVTVIESLYVEHLHTSTRFLIGLSEDRNIILDYASQITCDTDFLTSSLGRILLFVTIKHKHLGMNSENQRQLLDEQADEWVKQESTIFVTDCFEVFGLATGKFEKNSAIRKRIEFEKDYSESWFYEIA